MVRRRILIPAFVGSNPTRAVYKILNLIKSQIVYSFRNDLNLKKKDVMNAKPVFR